MRCHATTVIHITIINIVGKDKRQSLMEVICTNLIVMCRQTMKEKPSVDYRLMSNNVLAFISNTVMVRVKNYFNTTVFYNKYFLYISVFASSV